QAAAGTVSPKGTAGPVDPGTSSSSSNDAAVEGATAGAARAARSAVTTRTTATGGGRSAAPSSGSGSPLAGPLRALAARRGIAMGAAVSTSGDLADATYSSVVSSEYSAMTPENDMKWSATEPGPGVYNFVAPDLDVSFAEAHGMLVRGHNLSWWADNPNWLTTVPYTRDQLISILHDHIATVVGHYKAKVAQWDVVNEGLNGGFWMDHIGPEYMDMAFTWAHEADPSAKLFYNETGAEGLGGKSDQVYALVRGMKQRGVPIDGVGLESHFDLDPPPLADIAANMRRLNALGLQTAITELDVRLQVPASAPDLDRQRVIYNGLLATCAAAANCKTFVTWGFTDKDSWVPNAYPGYGAALPFDQNYAPKPAYFGLRAALGG
ncbi:MAG: endo-1,4-beta-xylanase, partial [Acidimicrobiia bacterium]|nr:endo-1,4-beta-xylanase [Acidimicrobiia bacterium]